MRIMAGLAGGVMATLAMDAYVWALSAGGRQREAEDATPGDDRLARGVQPAQAETVSSHDAPVRAGAAAYRAMTGTSPDRTLLPWLGTAAHYGLGLTAGLCYGMAIDRAPWLRVGFGTLYGALVWALADEGLVPAAGLSRQPRQLSPSLHAFALGGHFAYGVALEGTVRLISGNHGQRQQGNRTRERRAHDARRLQRSPVSRDPARPAGRARPGRPGRLPARQSARL